MILDCYYQMHEVLIFLPDGAEVNPLEEWLMVTSNVSELQSAFERI